MAPSPTGAFHVGLSRTALFNWLFARHHRGVFILRVEDTDRERSSDDWMRENMEAMRWLGLDWDEGPDREGPYGPYRQSLRMGGYQAALDRLLAADLAYPCYCTPAELETHRKEMQLVGKPWKYNGRCRDPHTRARLKAEGRPEVIRFKMPDEGTTGWRDEIRGTIEFDNAVLDDLVIRKSDGMPTYNFAAVVDDHAMAVTHVIRGDDHISNTPRQIQMYRALGYEPPAFAHLPMVLGMDKTKLSSRHGALPILEYRNRGYLPGAVFNYIALLGWGPSADEEIFPKEELARRFELGQVGKGGSVFDPEKLLWMNGQYLHKLSPEEFFAQALPFLTEASLVPANADAAAFDYARQAVELEREKARSLGEVPGLVDFIFRDPAYDPVAVEKWLAKDWVPAAFDRLESELRNGKAAWTAEGLEQLVRGCAESLGLSASKIIHPLRVAVSGRTAGPSLFHLLEVLGRERVLQRLHDSRRFLIPGGAASA